MVWMNWVYPDKRNVCLNGNELINNTNANQGIKESIKNTFTFTLIALTLPLSILFAISFSYVQDASINAFYFVKFGLGFALIFGITFAGIPVIQHFSLRLIL